MQCIFRRQYGAVLLLAACTASPAPDAATADGAAAAVTAVAAAPDIVRAGIDVLLEGNLAWLRGRRLGLLTNQTGVSVPGSFTGAATRSTIDALHAHPELHLVALFSPEHGIRGTVEAGVAVASGVDQQTGLPIHSLYGDVRQPTAAMLRDIDVLLVDMQDIGTRYYTYVWTMVLAMRAAAEHGRTFVVLDRPNPLGGTHVQGNVLDPAFATFVGLHDVPMRHGLTAGELARLVNAEAGIGAELVVVPARGWRRSMWYDETALPWVAPSPNMPSLESALHYPGTCLFEGTNLSVGRGTPGAFQQIGAPWLDAPAIADALNRRGMPGVHFDAVRFTPHAPGDGKFDGVEVAGIRFQATNRDAYDPTIAAVAALVEIRRRHGDELHFFLAHFDRLAGTDRLRLGLLRGADVETLTDAWQAQLAAFEVRRAEFLIYP